MRIVIDMQGAQTESRYRGIGRYTLSFAQAIVRNRGEHEVFLALSGLFPDTIEPIRAAFDGLLPQENIRVWYAPGPVRERESGNALRREVAELIREAFLASMRPDVIHICSLFEGEVDDAVTSIGQFDRNTPVSVSLYDLIPLLNPEQYLQLSPSFRTYYERKVGHLSRANLMLAISEFSRKEGLEHLDVASEQVVNVSTAIEDNFKPLEFDDEVAAIIRTKYKIRRPFILYTGGGDERKNLHRLIQAYTRLAPVLRGAHQLVLAGKVSEELVALLGSLTRIGKLSEGEVCLIGYVTDDELIALYNLCAVFVFPSWHEGFGLPALEAMACGAPVIGANATSLPEVIGLEAALFDPFNIDAIAAKMAQVLEDETFRAELREHGLLQAERFSWDETARRAFVAWESLHGVCQGPNNYIDRSQTGKRLIQSIAALLPAPDYATLSILASCLAKNQSAGIERQLLLDVSELSQRDSATGVQRVVRSYLHWLLQSPPEGFRIEPVYATCDEGYRYARRYTQHFLGHDETDAVDDPIRWQRGDIFFGLDMQHHVQLAHEAFLLQLRQDGVVVKFLVHDLLPIQFADLFSDSGASELHACWLAMIAATDGAVCVSKATADAFSEWIDNAGLSPVPTFKIEWVHNGGDIDGSRPSAGLSTESETVLQCIQARKTFLCVATLEPRKGQLQILEAIEQLWKEGFDVNLVFVGQQGWKIEVLAERIASHHEFGQRLFWLKGISDEYLEKVYAASTCLIAASLNEGYGLPLIEAAEHAVPIVARDIPVFREVAGDAAFYFSGETGSDLAAVLKGWLDLYQAGSHPKSELLRWSTWQESTEKLKVALVKENYTCRQLLVDVSEIVQSDARTGIQRVTRSILQEWLKNPPPGYRIEPVYATVETGYRYARQFTQKFLRRPDESFIDEPIEYSPEDLFFGLDLSHHCTRVHADFLREMHRSGVRISFLVHDLLPIEFPHFWEGQHQVDKVHEEWLAVITSFDGAICVSKTVADRLAEWINSQSQERKRPFKIDFSHNGADIENSNPTMGLPIDAKYVLDNLRGRLSFLTVGTLEPRKGHVQLLDAFEELWRKGSDINLVIVGKQGWMVESLVERLRTHPERGQHFFWLENISDEYLEEIYAASTCLIAASYGEGFGLPLIEAAQHKLPIIARDIPVFREVAGEHAFYFDVSTTSELVARIREWLSLYKQGTHPGSEMLPWLTWSQSAQNLLAIILSSSRVMNAGTH